MNSQEKYKCHLLLWNDSLSGWYLGELDMPTIEKLDKEIAIYQSHMVQLYDGTAPPTCYRGGLSAASDIYDFKKKSGTRLDVLECPYQLKVIVEHDFADDDLERTICAEYTAHRWDQYYRMSAMELHAFIIITFDEDDTVSLGHRFFPILKGILAPLDAPFGRGADRSGGSVIPLW